MPFFSVIKIKFMPTFKRKRKDLQSSTLFKCCAIVLDSLLPKRTSKSPLGTVALLEYLHGILRCLFWKEKLSMDAIKKKPHLLGVPWYHMLCDHHAAAAKSLQSCLTLCDPINGSPPGSPVPGILQARTLEWVAISFSNHESKKWKWSRSVVSNS